MKEGGTSKASSARLRTSAVGEFAEKKSLPELLKKLDNTTHHIFFADNLPKKMPTSKAPDGNARAKKKSAPSMKPSRAAPPPASFKSAEYVQESDSDDPASSEKGNESDSDEESLLPSPADVMGTSNGKLQRPAGSSSSSENESESDENVSEVNDEEEEDLVVAAKENPVVPVK